MPLGRIMLAAALATSLAAPSVDAATSTTPVGGRLAFASSSLQRIRVVDTVTGEVATVAAADAEHAVIDPTWSPDGRRLAFGDTFGVVEPVLGTLRVVNVATRRTRTVVSLPTLFVLQTAWSPRGDRIAFTTSTVYTPVWGLALSHHSVHVVDVDGTDHLVLGGGADPAWSPDGRTLAYASTAGPIVVVDPDDVASASTVGAPFFWTAAKPTWSPDGRQIAFLDYSGLLGPPTLWVGTVNGIGGTEVRPLPVFTSSPPTWGPDGTSLAYEDRGIVVIDTRTFARRRLTFEEDGGVNAPAWSPNRLIAFTRRGAVETVDPINALRTTVARVDSHPWLVWSPA